MSVDPPSPTPAKAYLQESLSRINELSPALAGMRLTDWYVIVVHENAGGETIMSRFNRHGQPPWTDVGLLTFAKAEDLREWAIEDEILEEES